MTANCSLLQNNKTYGIDTGICCITLASIILLWYLIFFCREEHVAANTQSLADFNDSQTAKNEPVVNAKNNKPLVTPKSVSNPSPDILKPINNAPPPVGLSTKPMPKKETK